MPAPEKSSPFGSFVTPKSSRAFLNFFLEKKSFSLAHYFFHNGNITEKRSDPNEPTGPKAITILEQDSRNFVSMAGGGDGSPDGKAAAARDDSGTCAH